MAESSRLDSDARASSIPTSAERCGVETSRVDSGAQAPSVRSSCGCDRRPPLICWHHQRHQAVRELLKNHPGNSKLVDLGCHDGEFLESLARQGRFAQVVGVDKCQDALAQAHDRLLALPQEAQQRAQLVHTSLLLADSRLCGFDVGTCLEVVEHIDPWDLPAFAEIVFRFANLSRIILTTPNQEYNCIFGLGSNQWRHPDHRFEWARREFHAWADSVAATYGYNVQYFSVGNIHPDFGAPTQAAIFTRR